MQASVSNFTEDVDGNKLNCIMELPIIQRFSAADEAYKFVQDYVVAVGS